MAMLDTTAARFGALHTALHTALPRTRHWTRLRDLLALRHQRRALAALDGRMLADIGVTCAQAQAEAGRPFWDAPRHWRG